MIKAITFDLDNTMIDFMAFKKEATYQAAKAMKKAGFKRGVKKLNSELYAFYLEYGLEEGDIIFRLGTTQLAGGLIDFSSEVAKAT